MHDSVELFEGAEVVRVEVLQLELENGDTASLTSEGVVITTPLGEVVPITDEREKLLLEQFNVIFTIT